MNKLCVLAPDSVLGGEALASIREMVSPDTEVMTVSASEVVESDSLPTISESKLDALIYWCDVAFSLSLVTKALTLAGPNPPILIVLSNAVARKSVAQAVAHLTNVPMINVRVPFFAPPTSGAIRRGVLAGPLENVCFGVALGVVRELKVNASQPTGLVPIDTALRIAVASIKQFRLRRLKPMPSSNLHAEINVGTKRFEDVLVWGMVGEYAIDYYGRYSDQIRRAMHGDDSQKLSAASTVTTGTAAAAPSSGSKSPRQDHGAKVAGLVTSNPDLSYTARFQDMWNFGLRIAAPPLRWWDSSASASALRHLDQFPFASVTQNVQSALRNMASVVDALCRVGYVDVDDSNGNYAALLRHLTPAEREDCDVRLIEWEGYVKRVCVGVLNYMAVHVMDLRPPPRFPTPTYLWHNDFAFSGPLRAPPPSLSLRRIFDDYHFALRGGQLPNGGRVKLRPGGRPQRKTAILAQPHVQMMLSTVAKEEHVSKEHVYQRGMSILNRISDNINHNQARTLAYLVRKMFHSLYTQVNINAGAFNMLWKVFRRPRTCVVMLPAHRSYIDFVVLSFMLMVMGLPFPHICSGEDFLRLGFISNLMRGAGAFFMRRSFRGDKMYAALFKEYVRHLARDGQCVEFFLEGKRSRTGKTLPPKVGILKMITDAFLEKQEEFDEVLFLPIGLSYDKLLEGGIYAQELLGVPKPKETIPNLIAGSTHVLKAQYGSLNVTFGEPISMKQFVAAPTELPEEYRESASAIKEPLATLPVDKGVPGASGSAPASYTPSPLLSCLAWRLTYDIQKNVVVTPTAIVAAVCLHLHRNGELKQGVPAAHIANEAQWLRHRVLRAGGRMSDALAGADGVQLVEMGAKLLSPVVTLSTGLNHLHLVKPTVDSLLLLSIYSNQLLHIFGDVAALTASALAVANTSTVPTSTFVVPEGEDKTNELTVLHVPEAQFLDNVRFLKSLLQQVYPNFLPSSPIPENVWLHKNIDRMATADAIAKDKRPGAVSIVRNAYVNFTAQVFYPFIETFFFVLVGAHALTVQPRIPEGVFVNSFHKFVLEGIQKEVVHFMQVANREDIGGAIGRLVEMSLFKREAGPPAALMLHPSARKDDEAGLKSLTRRVNGFRWQPADDAALENLCAAAKNAIGKAKPKL